MYWQVEYQNNMDKCWISTFEAFYFFFDTPTVRPRRPVVFVCWPRTRRLCCEKRNKIKIKVTKALINNSVNIHTPSSDEVLGGRGFSSGVQDLHEVCFQACWKWPWKIYIELELTSKTKNRNNAYLGKFTILDILLPIQKPIGDFVLTGVGHDGDQLLNLFN